jgi:hypothetical protein
MHSREVDPAFRYAVLWLAPNDAQLKGLSIRSIPQVVSTSHVRCSSVQSIYQLLLQRDKRFLTQDCGGQPIDNAQLARWLRRQRT